MTARTWKAGNVRHESRHGTLMLDRPATAAEIELIDHVLDQTGLTPADVTEISADASGALVQHLPKTGELHYGTKRVEL